MSYQEYIKNEVLTKRLKEKRVVVVYDDQKRYQAVCEELESENCTVILTPGKPISSRLVAMKAWQELLADETLKKQLLIYCQDPLPLTNLQKQQHPFAQYLAMGTTFPNTKATDTYKELCGQYLPQRKEEIAQLFSAGEPSFEEVNQLNEGENSFPRLAAIFKTQEASSILKDFMAPSSLKDKGIEEELTASDAWVSEMHSLLKRTTGLTLKTSIKNIKTIREQLWQYILFSEFSHDLPTDLPESLQSVKKAEELHVNFVTKISSDLRKGDYKEDYRDYAEEVVKNLNLVEECEEHIATGQLGDTDTFSFEESTYLKRACLAVKIGDEERLNEAEAILRKHKDTLWTEDGERQILWSILERALDTLLEIKKAKQTLKDDVGTRGYDLVQAYVDTIVEVDRRYRELESAVAELLEGTDEIVDLIEKVRTVYREHFNSFQLRFLKDVKREGWPLEGVNSNNSVHTRLIAPAMRENKRVVYFQIDALRLDLAKGLTKSVNEKHSAVTNTNCAQLPCITKYAMPALLPNAESLTYKEEGGTLKPYIGEQSVALRSERMSVLEQTWGDRFTETKLETFLKETNSPKKREGYVKNMNADLLVITSTEIDLHGEVSTRNLKEVSTSLRDLQTALLRCGEAELGFDLAVVATDHGFIWIEDQGIDTTVSAPESGEWFIKKRRCLLGQGDTGIMLERFDSSELSIPTELPSFIVPQKLATFKNGNGYFHEGLSLQESIVPELVVTFKRQEETPLASKRDIILDTRKQKRTFRSRMVAVYVSWAREETLDLFSSGEDQECEIKLVAMKGSKIVGEPTSTSANVDGDSGLVKVRQGDALKLTIKLDEEMENGEFQVKAFDPLNDRQISALKLTFDSDF